MPSLRIYTGDIVSAIQLLEEYFCKGGVSIVQAAFAHSYFVHPDKVRAKTPYYPDRAHTSREHYRGHGRGDCAIWHGDGRDVRLSNNQPAQNAWKGYTGHPIARRSGYEMRHIWGNNWNPDAFTAGWNLLYMPFWASMPTKEQHEHPQLAQAFRQASWDIYFKDNPVCKPPDFVSNPNLDLESILDGQPVLILDTQQR